MSANSDSHSAQIERNMVKEIVRSILILDFPKKPFKYSDIVSNMNPKPPRKKWPQLFTEAKNCLATMGLNLHETKEPQNKLYFVTSQTQPLEIMYKYASEEEVSDRILLTFVLAFIFMKNGTVSSDGLLRHLGLLGIYNESKTSHRYFGDVKKKVMTDFPEQLYLSLVRLPNNPDVCEIKWGERAELEISKRTILEFICKYGFGGKVRPQEHTSQYDQVLVQEGQKSPDHDDEMMLINIFNFSDDDSEAQEAEGEENKNHGSVESF